MKFGVEESTIIKVFWVMMPSNDVLDWTVVGWINLAQDRDQWTSLVNTVINLRIP
jgi:hypothetical protein